MYGEKRDNHDLVCSVKIIECQARLKQFTFWHDLNGVIRELERAILLGKQQNKGEGGGVDESHTDNKLVGLLRYCQKLQRHYEKRKD